MPCKDTACPYTINTLSKKSRICVSITYRSSKCVSFMDMNLNKYEPELVFTKLFWYFCKIIKTIVQIINLHFAFIN